MRKIAGAARTPGTAIGSKIVSEDPPPSEGAVFQFPREAIQGELVGKFREARLRIVQPGHRRLRNRRSKMLQQFHFAP